MHKHPWYENTKGPTSERARVRTGQSPKKSYETSHANGHRCENTRHRRVKAIAGAGTGQTLKWTNGYETIERTAFAGNVARLCSHRCTECCRSRRRGKRMGVVYQGLGEFLFFIFTYFYLFLPKITHIY